MVNKSKFVTIRRVRPLFKQLVVANCSISDLVLANYSFWSLLLEGNSRVGEDSKRRVRGIDMGHTHNKIRK